MSMRDYEELCRTADERATKVPFHRTVTHLVRARRSVDRGEPVWALHGRIGPLQLLVTFVCYHDPADFGRRVIC